MAVVGSVCGLCRERTLSPRACIANSPKAGSDSREGWGKEANSRKGTNDVRDMEEIDSVRRARRARANKQATSNKRNADETYENGTLALDMPYWVRCLAGAISRVD